MIRVVFTADLGRHLPARRGYVVDARVAAQLELAMILYTMIGNLENH